MNDLTVHEKIVLEAFYRARVNMVSGRNILYSFDFMSPEERLNFYDKMVSARKDVVKSLRESPDSVFSKVKIIAKMQHLKDRIGDKLRPLGRKIVSTPSKLTIFGLFALFVSPVCLAFFLGATIFNAVTFLAIVFSSALVMTQPSSTVMKKEEHALFVGWVLRSLQSSPALKSKVSEIPFVLDLIEHNLIENGYARELIALMQSLDAAQVAREIVSLPVAQNLEQSLRSETVPPAESVLVAQKLVAKKDQSEDRDDQEDPEKSTEAASGRSWRI